MIQLGLQRAAQLCRHIQQPWKAIHVAGTNGKGSICAYLSRMLQASGIRCGRFTSPHIIDRWDCIVIDQQPIDKSAFQRAEAKILALNEKHDIKATEFELLTATAFEIFTQQNVQVGVVEVGMGGRLDATNVLESKAVTVISKIGLDHQTYLGDTLEEIAKQKCGIFRLGVPVVFDPTNDPVVLKTIQDEAKAAGALVSDDFNYFDDRPLPSFDSQDPRLGMFLEQGLSHQLANAACAYRVAHAVLCSMGLTPAHQTLVDAIASTKLLGRTQRLDLKPLLGIPSEIILDGAHNPQSAEGLASFVEKSIRRPRDVVDEHRSTITWVIAASDGKDLEGILRPLLQRGDIVGAVEFGDVDGMPWVKAMPSKNIISYIESLSNLAITTRDFGSNISNALSWAAREQPDDSHRVVVSGSLYLVSDVLRMIRNAGVNIYA